jgi:hypothetical protein
MRILAFTTIVRERTNLVWVALAERAQEGATMRNSPSITLPQEPTDQTRKDIRAAVGRCLRHFYDGSRKQPLPDHLKQLLARLESDGTSPGSGAT